eukprot:1152578-Amphidinium_carterae.1
MRSQVMWEIDTNEEDGRHIHLQLQKAVELEKWPALLDGADHPRIDVHLVRFYCKEHTDQTKLVHHLDGVFKSFADLLCDLVPLTFVRLVGCLLLQGWHDLEFY